MDEFDFSDVKSSASSHFQKRSTGHSTTGSTNRPTSKSRHRSTIRSRIKRNNAASSPIDQQKHSQDSDCKEVELSQSSSVSVVSSHSNNDSSNGVDNDKDDNAKNLNRKSRRKRRRLNTFTSQVGKNQNNDHDENGDSNLFLNTIQEDEEVDSFQFVATKTTASMSMSKQNTLYTKQRYRSNTRRNHDSKSSTSSDENQSFEMSIMKSISTSKVSTPLTPPSPQTPQTPPPSRSTNSKISQQNKDVNSSLSTTTTTGSATSTSTSKIQPKIISSKSRHKFVRFQDEKFDCISDNNDLTFSTPTRTKQSNDDPSPMSILSIASTSSPSSHSFASSSSLSPSQIFDHDNNNNNNNSPNDDTEDYNNKVTGAGMDVFALQDAGSFRFVQDDCLYLCSSFLSEVKNCSYHSSNDDPIVGSSFISSDNHTHTNTRNIIVKHNCVTADIVCDLIKMLSLKKTRHGLMNISSCQQRNKNGNDNVNGDYLSQESWMTNNSNTSCINGDNDDNDVIHSIMDVLSYVPSAICGNILPPPILVLKDDLDDENDDDNHFCKGDTIRTTSSSGGSSEFIVYYDCIVSEALALLAQFVSYDCTWNNKYSASSSLAGTRSFRKMLLQHKGAMRGIARCVIESV